MQRVSTAQSLSRALAAIALSAFFAPALRAADSVGVRAESAAPAQAFGAEGISHGAGNGSAGAAGESLATSGPSHGVVARSSSPQGFAGFFQSPGGGDLLRGSAAGAGVFRVSSSAVVTAAVWHADGRGLLQYGDLDCAGCITGTTLAANGLNAANLAVGAVGPTRIVDGAVGAAEIAAGAVEGLHLAAQSVTASQLTANAVTAAKLADGLVLGENLALGAVGRPQLADEAVTPEKINGSERTVYRLEPGCPERGVLTRALRCFTELCDDDPESYWNCSRTSCSPGSEPQTCQLDAAGKVLSPFTPL